MSAVTPASDTLPVLDQLFDVAHVDMILKGAKPADLPEEQPMKYPMEVKLKTAKALGI